MLATTNTRALLDAEKTQRVRNQVDKFEKENIKVYQTFINSALVKYNRIIREYGNIFNGSCTTIQQDIVAMLANTTTSRTKVKPPNNRPPPVDMSGNKNGSSTRNTLKIPPFAKFFKVSTSEDST